MDGRRARATNVNTASKKHAIHPDTLRKPRTDEHCTDAKFETNHQATQDERELKEESKNAPSPEASASTSESAAPGATSQ